MPILINVLLAAFLAAAPAQTPSPPPIGFVLSMHGPWQVDGRAVKPGQAVAPGAKLVLAPTARFDTGEQFSISVVLLNNVPVGCPTLDLPDCRRGVAIPTTLNERPSLFAKLADVCALIFQSPERWVGLVSRDLGRVNMSDGVISFDDGRVSVTQVLAGVPAGDFAVRFAPIADAGQPNRKDVSVNVQWTGRAPATLQAPLGLGLYRVTLSRTGVPTMVGREAWMLAAGSAQVASLRTRYDAAVAMTRAWEPSVPHPDIERFLHAYLAELAREK
jgi:hypothetical protein